MKTINKQLICKPFAKPFNDPIKKGKVEMIKRGISLEGLEVLLDAHIVHDDYEAEVKAGQTVYVRADRYVSNWGKEKVTCPELLTKTITDENGVSTFDPVEFIVVPFSEVIAIKE
jgi:hypothetical protein